MKAILLSVQPKWVEKILNKEKTIEIRKTAPKRELPIDVYIYCTKGYGLFINRDINGKHFKFNGQTAFLKKTSHKNECCNLLNGKVVAKFTLREITTMCERNKDGTTTHIMVDKQKFEEYSCMTIDEYHSYHKVVNGRWQNSYAWYISDLQIFDKPMELWEFYAEPKRCRSECQATSDLCADCKLIKSNRQLKRPPQSWQFVEIGV